MEKTSINELKEFLKKNYAITSEKVEVNTGGWINESYYIKDQKGKEYIFRISPGKSINQLKWEVDLLNKLKELDIPRPVTNLKNEHLIPFNNSPAVLLEYLPGDIVNSFDDKTLGLIGSFLASMHNKTIGMIPSDYREKIFGFDVEGIEGELKRCEKVAHPILKEIRDYVSSRVFETNNLMNLPSGGIHADILPQNTLRINENKIGIIDFDNAYVGPLLIDLAVTIMWYCTPENNLDLGRAKTLIESYNKIRALTPEENDSLWRAICFAYVRFVIRALRFYEENPSNEKMKACILEILPRFIEAEKALAKNTTLMEVLK